MTDYHWTPALERAFVECLSETGSVTEACKSVSMSRRAAYDRKRRAAGLAFRMGWDAAILLVRDVVADELLDRALAGQWTETIRDKETGQTRRYAQDRRLGLALLTRLDRMCDFLAAEGSVHMAAQIVSQDFEAFLDLMTADPVDSASVRDVRAFLSEREDAWRLGDQLPRGDGMEIKAEAGPRLGGRGDGGDEIQCEVTRFSADSEVGMEAVEEAEQAYGALDGGRNQPHHMPFRSISSTTTPQIGHPDYHRWIKNQTWARM
jgi:hypothetical protein